MVPPNAHYRSLLPLLLLLLPLGLALLLSQQPHPWGLDQATARADGLLTAFDPVEQQDGPAYRWARPGATLALPAAPSAHIIELYAAIAPAAEALTLQLDDQAPIALPSAPGFRRYRLLVPPGSDAYGWRNLRVAGVPAGNTDDPRPLLLALAHVRLLPNDGPVTPLPQALWLMLLLLPPLIASGGWLAGLPRAPALLLGTGSGSVLAWAWWHDPAALRPLLLDLGALATTPVIWQWWLIISGLGLAALPLSTLIFRHLPLAGYAFARTSGLLLSGWLAWLLAMAGGVPFGRGSMLLAAVMLLLIGLLLRRPQRPHRPPAGEGGAMLRGILGFELLFVLALCLGVWLRWHGAVGPAIYGTEKPMELVFLSGILRSPSFPPLDPWFGGYAINYYYLGYVLIAGLQALSGTSLGTAFNLGTATVFALTAQMLAGLVISLAGLARRERAGSTALPRGLGSTALLAILLVLIAGNQMGALQLLLGSGEARALSGSQMLAALGERLHGAETIQVSAPAGVAGVPASITPAGQQSFDWFSPSRAVFDDVATGSGQFERRYVITEFPFFSFYLGDLHPHVLTLPFSLLALALALAATAAPSESRRPWLARLAITGIVLGCLYAINSWDAPIYALLFAGATLLGRRRLPAAAGEVLLAGLIAGMAVLPFLLSFVPPAGPGVGNGNLPFLRTFAPAPSRTSLYGFLLIFGLFVVVLLAYAWSIQPQAGRLIAGISLAALIGGGLIGFPLLALLPLSLGLARQSWHHKEQPAQAFALWSIAVGALIIFAADTLYVRDHQEATMPRMITVFKFYYQAWLLWGIIAAFAAGELLRRARRRPHMLLWAGPALLLLAGSLAYPAATLSRGEPWRPAERTLDGLAYLWREHPAEAAAMGWLAANARPDALLLTAFCNCDYDQIGRVAAVTGQPTMLGWLDGHETLWRSGAAAQLAEIRRREAIIPKLYTSNDLEWTRRMLAQYSIGYVYIGPTERRLHGGPGLAKFSEFMELVFAEEGVEVYRWSEVRGQG
jgi:YYY domain-containing protein